MPSLLELLDRAKKDRIVAYGDTTYLPINNTDSLNSDVGKYESKDTSLEKVLKKSLKNPLDIQNVFDKADRLIIDTRGVVNPYRTTILTEKFQSDTIGGEILQQTVSLAGSILKQRIRIPDTIFPSKNKPGPISNIIRQPQNAARGEKDIEKNTAYYVKTVFKPGAEILGGAARSAIQGDLRSAKQEALQAGLNLGRKLGRQNKLTLNDEYIQSSYHPAAMDLNLDGRIGGKKGAKNGEETAKVFTEFKEYYLRKAGALAFNGVPTTNGMIKTLKERDPNDYKHHADRMIDYLIAGMFPVGVVPEESVIPWIKLHPLGFEPMYLPGTISGLSEEVQPTWETFKYIGSPFNSYKYNGVERTIQFNLKLYWREQEQMFRLKQQLEYIKELCFPAPDVSIAKYKNSPTGSLGASDQLFYRPQFLELTIHGYAKKMFGFIETLNITIPDDTTWPSTNTNAEFSDASKPPGTMPKAVWSAILGDKIYPSNVEVSIGFKIIENPHAQISGEGSKVKYNYNLDGAGPNTFNQTNNKYPSRPNVIFVPQEDVTKRDETPTDATPPPATPNKVVPAKKKKSSNKKTNTTTTTATVPSLGIGATSQTNAPWVDYAVKNGGTIPATWDEANQYGWRKRLIGHTLSADDIHKLAAKEKLNSGLSGN